MKKTGGVLIVVVLAGLAVWQYGRGSHGNLPRFRTQAVMRGNLFIGVTSGGSVEPTEIIDVGAQILASVKSFGPDLDRPGKTIDYCSRVKQGTVLAHLDDLLPKADLNKARVNVQLAEADRNNWRARSLQAHRDFARAKELVATDSKESYDKAEAEDTISKAELAMAEARLDQAKVAVTEAEINLGYTVITSPIDGEVIDRRVNVGQTVVAGLNAPTLFLLARDLSRMQVCAAVNEADMAEIRVGQTATFTVDACPDRVFSGTVSQIRHNASLTNSVVTYSVIIDFDNSTRTLRPYTTAKVQFEVARRKDAVLVPNQALRWRPTWSQVSPAAQVKLTPPVRETRRAEVQDDSAEDVEPKVEMPSPAVWTVGSDGLVRPIPVRAGLSDGTVTEILEGALRPGDTVVTSVLPQDEPDFVKSFVNQVTNTKTDPP